DPLDPERRSIPVPAPPHPYPVPPSHPYLTETRFDPSDHVRTPTGGGRHGPVPGREPGAGGRPKPGLRRGRLAGRLRARVRPVDVAPGPPAGRRTSRADPLGGAGRPGRAPARFCPTDALIDPVETGSPTDGDTCMWHGTRA